MNHDIFFFVEGERVVVNGETDGIIFHNEPGIVKLCNGSYGPYQHVRVEFDTWDDGWGEGCHTWGCRAETIYPVLEDEESVDHKKAFNVTIDQLFEE